MKNIICVLICLVLGGCAKVSYVAVEEIAIIPQVGEMSVGDGVFGIGANAEISFNDESLLDSAILLGRYAEIDDIEDGFDDDAEFVLQLNDIVDNELGDEGYLLSIDEDGVLIRANTASGIFYGVQTIRQMLPMTVGVGERAGLKYVEIKDVPRYEWRGFMLDEARHFFGKEKVLETLDIMAFYKMNRFHWHLTDMNGWRLEIKKYPKLTSVGGKGDWSSANNPGGFYTQEDVKEVLEYAKVRHIVVVPEIDMPGHATAANLAYPEFSGGGTERHPEFTFNPGLEGTYEYLTDILKETAELFPSPWLHFGGDEVTFAIKQWKDNADVQALMEREGLKSLHEVETYFNRRMADVIDGLGKVTVGWDEVVDAGLKPEKTVVMWWRHNMPGQLAKALDQGFDVVLCPRIPCYLDFVQYKNHKYGRTWKGYCDLKGAYEFPDKPVSYKAGGTKQILGIQANLWTEKVHNKARFDYMTYPRLSALAEASWTAKEDKDFGDYERRLKEHMKFYDVWGIEYFDYFDPEGKPEPMWPVQK